LPQEPIQAQEITFSQAPSVAVFLTWPEDVRKAAEYQRAAALLTHLFITQPAIASQLTADKLVAWCRHFHYTPLPEGSTAAATKLYCKYCGFPHVSEVEGMEACPANIEATQDVMEEIVQDAERKVKNFRPKKTKSFTPIAESPPHEHKWWKLDLRDVERIVLRDDDTMTLVDCMAQTVKSEAPIEELSVEQRVHNDVEIGLLLGRIVETFIRHLTQATIKVAEDQVTEFNLVPPRENRPSDAPARLITPWHVYSAIRKDTNAFDFLSCIEE